MNKTETLIKLVNEHLQNIHSSSPFSAMIKTDAGHDKAVDMIIRYAIKNQMSIGAAIGQLESELE